jgi:prepilin-type N-terminal cleavage/methylation domain-containing protein
MNKRANGYSLIEVLVAIAITSVVLLTVLSLFYMGRRNVYGGKQMTEATAVATRIMEDLEQMTSAQLRSNFNLTDTPLPATVTLKNVAGRGDVAYTGSLARDTSACTISSGVVTCTNDSAGYMAKWYSQVLVNGNPNGLLLNPTIGLVVTPRSPRITDGSHNVSTAQFTTVRAYVAWDEGPGLRRYAFFTTTKY